MDEIKTHKIEKMDEHDGEYYLLNEPDLPMVGMVYALKRVSDVSPNALREGNDTGYLVFNTDPETIDGGWSGNSTPAMREHHGWRGTTNDLSVDALGVRECTRAEVKMYKKTYHVIIKFGPCQCSECDI